MSNSKGKIIDVYEENILDELRKISELAEEFNYISMDTEFPGVIFPLTAQSNYRGIQNMNFNTINTKLNNNMNNNLSTETNYQNVKLNVDNLKVIQIGLTLANKDGLYPEDVSTWQFNFKFDLLCDTYLTESINLLEIAGIDFTRFVHEGIEKDYFAEHFISSGIVLNDEIKWITFHGTYDFAYLLKTISNQPLPEDENSFCDYINLYFPVYYDVRYLIKNSIWLKGSLTKIAGDLDIKRIGQSHQAGSDSLITSKVFFKLINNQNENIDLIDGKNKLFGVNYKSCEEEEVIQNGDSTNGSVSSYIINNNQSTVKSNFNNFNYMPTIYNMYTPTNNPNNQNKNIYFSTQYPSNAIPNMQLSNSNIMYTPYINDIRGYFQNYYVRK